MKFAIFTALFAFALLDCESRANSPASFAYILQADAFDENKAAAVEKLTSCGRDWIVLDAHYDGDTPWQHSDLDAIRKGHPTRKIIAYISIGEAEDYRPYWHKEWGNHGKFTSSAPTWMGKENPDWQGNYRVKYWNADWQKIILTAVDDVMTCGFDGVYLDIVDGFQTYEQAGKDYVDDRKNPETQQTFRRDMVEWVKTIAARARAKNPSALVIPQNGSQLLAHADFLTAISGIGIEDLFTNDNKLQDKSHTSDVLGDLKQAKTARKPVLLIEYPKDSARKELSKKLAKENGLIWLVTDRELKTLGASGI